MKISGYMTSRNSLSMNFPFEEAIQSLFSFCDEIVICDTSDGTDNTKEKLGALQKEFNGEFKIIHNPDEVDWSAPNHGIYDGITKGIARSGCTGDYCFQIDADEVIETTRKDIEKCCEQLDDEHPLLSLPVIEYWGSSGKVRLDVNFWKWRLSKNLSNITHGIPGSHRKYENRLMYAYPGTDGCDYINKNSLKTIPCTGFVTQKVEEIRQRAVFDKDYVEAYENWANQIVNRLPTVHHFSWWSIYNKMQKYKLFWNNSWITLYNEKRDEGYNPFFNKPFDQVTEQEMRDTAAKIETETGGHIFHNPWTGQKTNHMKINKPIPKIIKNWCEKNKS